MTRKKPTVVVHPNQMEGRPSRLNVVLATAIINTLSGGAYITTACTFVGISRQSYFSWRHRGEAEMTRVGQLGYDPEDLTASFMTGMDEDGRITSTRVDEMFATCPAPFNPDEWAFVVFYLQTDKARAASEIRALTAIQKAGSGGPDHAPQWQAHAWFLERTYRDKYGRADRLSLEGPNPGDPVKLEIVPVSDLEAKIRQLRGNTE